MIIRRVCALSILGAIGAPGAAVGQQSLPTIDVGAARRVAPHTAARQKPVRAAAPAARPRPASAAAEPSTRPETDGRGALPIVANRFGTVLAVPVDELRRLPGSTLGDLLFSKPGVTGSSYAPGAASRPIVRGLDNYRVRVQENGIGASGVSELGEDHGVPLDPLGANRVEVVRGPATLRWGPAATGGVVNVDNGRIPEKAPCDDARLFRETGCARVETRAALSTADSALENAMMLDAGHGQFVAHADVTGRRASDYRIPGYPYLVPPDPPPPVLGRQPNSAMRMGAASLGGSYVFDAGYTGVAVTQFDSVYHIPGIEPSAADTRIAMRQTRIAARGDLRPRSAYVDAIRYWVGVGDYRHHELGVDGGVDGIQQTFTSKELETRVEAQLTPVRLPVGTLKTFVGFQGNHQILTAPGADGGLFDPNRTKAVAGYLFAEWKMSDAQRLQLAGRVDHAEVTGSMPDFSVDPALALPRNRHFTPLSGAIGFLQDLPGDLVASLSAQNVARAPRAPELFSRGPHDATGTFDVGNPNLALETSKGVELSLRRAPGPFRFEASIFYTRFSGYIFRNLTGETCDAQFTSCTPFGEGGALAQAFYAQRNAVFRGGEFQSQLDLAPLAGGTFGVENQFDVVRASFTQGGNVPRIPPARLGGGFFWRDANWLARINLLHAFPQNAIAQTGETPTRGYDLLKAEVSYRKVFAPGDALGREMTVGVSGNNLLDQNIRNSVSYRKNEVLLPGANLRVFANFLF